MQGVIKSYDPGSGDGVLINEADLSEVDLAGTLCGSLVRMCECEQPSCRCVSSTRARSVTDNIVYMLGCGASMH